MTDVRTGPTDLRRAVANTVKGSLGNLVEWYDWFAYSFLATYIADEIFPKGTGNSLVPLLSTFAVFAVGFFARPIGGLVLGAVGDRIGRRALMVWSIALMGGATLAIGLLPNYETVGMAHVLDYRSVLF